MTETAIKVENVKKSFRLPTESTKSLRTAMANWTKGVRGYKTQEVLHDISFEVEQGDFFGIVGRNGSGKSTLLKIISQIYVPERGKVSVTGSLSSFIELGVGFNEELTGRENVYLNGAMLGFTTEQVNDMYDRIVDFAELEGFMDQKLKNYSSGMQVRLSFSIAIQTDADVLILDEVLAVGDEAFQRKSREYFKKVRENGKTVVLVTHDMNAVREYCNKAMLIDQGKVVLVSEDVDTVAMKYSELFIPEQLIGDDPFRMGNGKVTFEGISYELTADKLSVSCNIKNNNSVSYDKDLDFGITFYQNGTAVAGNHLFWGDYKGLELTENEIKKIQIEIPNRFGDGEFTADVSLSTDRGREVLDLIRVAFTFTNVYSKNSNSVYRLPFQLTDETAELKIEK